MALPDAWLELVADLLESPRPLPTERVATALIATLSLTGCAFNDTRPVPGAVHLWPSDSEFSEVGRDIQDWMSAYGSWEHPLLVFYEQPLGRREHHARASPSCAPTRSRRRSNGGSRRCGGYCEYSTAPGRRPPASTCRRAATPGSPAARASVLGLLAEGLTARLAARRLGVAERTVHKHQERLYAKLGVHDRVNAVARARVRGLLGSPSHRAVEIDPPATDRHSGRA